MTKPICPECGESNLVFAYDHQMWAGGCDFWQCWKCGNATMVTRRPLPTTAEVKRIFGPGNFADRVRTSRPSRELWLEEVAE